MLIYWAFGVLLTLPIALRNGNLPGLQIGALWFLLSFVFFPLGKIIYRIGKDAIDEMNREDNKNEKEKQ